MSDFRSQILDLRRYFLYGYQLCSPDLAFLATHHSSFCFLFSNCSAVYPERSEGSHSVRIISTHSFSLRTQRLSDAALRALLRCELCVKLIFQTERKATTQNLQLILQPVLLQLHSISITQFKNYSNRSFQFNERIIGICGNNGVGKTNLLDAIHYLCFTKSYFTRDVLNIQSGQQGFRVDGELELNDKKEKAVCILRETGKKEFSINDSGYEKFSEHIGRYPCVIIAPDDIQIITDGSEERRRFLDALLSQIDKDYLQHLINYNKILAQRNSLLKSFYETGNKNLSLLDVLDEQLIKPGEYIFEKRKQFLISFFTGCKKALFRNSKTGRRNRTALSK